MGRVDALGKVLGAKTFVRDLRAADVAAVDGEDWGSVTWRALLLRASHVDRPFAGVDAATAVAYGATRCFVRQGDEFVDVVKGQDRYRLRFAFGLFGASPVDLFVDTGAVAVFAGQPVAMALFEDGVAFVAAERELADVALRYGPPSTPTLPGGFDGGSPIGAALEAWTARGELPPPAALYGGQGVKVGRRVGARFGSIERSFEQGTTVRLRTSTPTVDPAFLEPDSGLGRVTDAGGGKVAVTVYVPSQSPTADARNVAGFLAANTVPSKVQLRTMALGGGFGGRDFSVFPMYAALAALIGGGTPVRLALDRPEQFASGTKRHASVFDVAVAFDDTGRLLGVRSKLVVDGGSQKDLTTAVKGLALHSSAGAYRFDHWDLRALAMRSAGPLSGSMRGFGIPQVIFGIEQCIDHVAHLRGEDPVAFRRSRVVRSGDLDADKQRLYHDVRNQEILDAVAAMPLWRDRDAHRGQRSTTDSLYGVGFALAMEAFGTTSDGAATAVTLTDDHRVVVHTEVIEMGQGATTGLAALFAAAFGVVPDDVEPGLVGRLAAPIASRPASEIYAKQGTTSASKSVFFHGHVLETIAGLWWRRVWLPAAAAIWGAPVADLDAAQARFDAERSLHHPGRSPIAWPDLCAGVLAGGRARVWGHGSFHGVWSWSRFRFGPGDTDAAWLDAVAIVDNHRWPTSRDLVTVEERVLPDDPRYGTDQRPTRTQRSVYASSGCVVAVTVDTASGVIALTDTVYVVDAGDRADDELVKGQIEGGFAQGVGFALTELYPGGPLGGQRLTNFDGYAVPRMSGLPPRGVRTVFVDIPAGDGVLHAIGADDPAPPPPLRKKGIAEISITPVAPAIANAVFHAMAARPAGGTLASRLLDLPISPAAVRRALREEPP